MKASALTPSGKRPPRFVRHIDRLINQSEKTQREIATAMGYDRSNIISMFKQGATRVPLEKVPALAEALETDTVELLTMWLAEYSPETLEGLQKHMGPTLSRNEKAWIAGLRKMFHGGVPPFDELAVDALKPLAARVEAERAA